MNNTVSTARERVVIVMPVYDDWLSLAKLVENLNALLGSAGHITERFDFCLLAVDDAPHRLQAAPNLPISGNVVVQKLSLQRNMGHQRAIAIGLAHALVHLSAQYMIVMDADGEDNPSDIPRLIDACSSAQDTFVVFAERTKRGESLSFRGGYLIYRWLHHILTGHRIRFGNYSIIPAKLAAMVVKSSYVWSHYAAAIVKLKLPYRLIPTQRGRRYFGHSSMSFSSLIAHGLTSMVLFYETVSVRLTMAFALFSLTGLSLTAWQLANGFSLLLLLGAIASLWVTGMILVLFQFFILLQSKTQVEIMPAKDAATFCQD